MLVPVTTPLVISLHSSLCCHGIPQCPPCRLGFGEKGAAVHTHLCCAWVLRPSEQIVPNAEQHYLRITLSSPTDHCLVSWFYVLLNAGCSGLSPSWWAPRLESVSFLSPLRDCETYRALLCTCILRNLWAWIWAALGGFPVATFFGVRDSYES